MLTRTLSYHQVAPGYLDFLFVFGKQTNPIDQAFAGFREQTSFRCDPNSPDLAVLGRSGKQLQLCYNLKGVASKSPPTSSIGSMEWSIRQVAVYHKYDFGTGKTLWILTRGGLDIKTRVEGLIGSANYSLDSAESSFRSSLALHLLYSYWAAENWRWYLRWRERLFADTVSNELDALLESALIDVCFSRRGRRHTAFVPHIRLERSIRHSIFKTFNARKMRLMKQFWPWIAT